MAKSIFVVGYPRSGNTYLSELLGEVLQAPILGVKGSIPVGEKKSGKLDGYIIHQAHLKPSDDLQHKELLPNSTTMATQHCNDELIVGVTRDARDVAASVWHYWQLDTIEKGIRAVALGEKPMRSHGSMKQYIDNWKKTGLVKYWTTYELLREDPVRELSNTLRSFDILADTDWIAECVERQAFERRSRKVEDGAHGMSYHQGIQRRHLWKGKVGNWREWFTAADIELADELLCEEMTA